jgi:hypothetical protein
MTTEIAVDKPTHEQGVKCGARNYAELTEL